MIKVNVEGTPIDIELDTGSSISVITLITFESSCKHLKLQPAKVKLRMYGDKTITPVGTVTGKVSHNGECHKAQLYVVSGPRVPHLGHTWLQLVQLDWPSIKLIQTNAKDKELTNLVEKHHNVFSDKLGCLRVYFAQLHIRDRATPFHQKHCTVPFAI